MERNYKKEFALLMKRYSEAQELAIAYQALYDDTLKRLQAYEDTPSSDDVEEVDEAQYQEVE